MICSLWLCRNTCEATSSSKVGCTICSPSLLHLHQQPHFLLAPQDSCNSTFFSQKEWIASPSCVLSTPLFCGDARSVAGLQQKEHISSLSGKGQVLAFELPMDEVTRHVGYERYACASFR